MKNLDENTITDAVLQRLENTPDARTKTVMIALVRHLHAFAREVQLTEAEWFAGIKFLTDTGQMCSETRQEFILLSDTLGLSTLVTAQNHRKPQTCTEATVFGPFHVEHAPVYALGADVANGAKGEPCFVNAAVHGMSGEAIPRAKVEVWQADADGFYDVQYAGDDTHRARGTLFTDEQGKVYFRSVLAEAYPIPHDGPVGKMLDATGRHPWRPAHLHFPIAAPGYQTLVTHVFRDGDSYLDSDAVFGVRSTLIAPWIRHEPGLAPDGSLQRTSFYTLDFNFVLNSD